MNDSEQKSMVNFKVGDKVRRNEKFAKPEIMPCYGMSKNTEYVIEHITPKGKLVLEDYLMLVDPEYVKLVEPIIGYYTTEYSLKMDCYIPISPVFLSQLEVINWNELHNKDSNDIEELEIDRNSLIDYIKNNNLM